MKLPQSVLHRPKLGGMGESVDVLDFRADVDPNYNGMPSDWSWIGDALAKVTTAWNQQKILEANIELMKQGKAPIDTRLLAPTYNVGMSPEVKQFITYGALGVVAFLAIKHFAK